MGTSRPFRTQPNPSRRNPTSLPTYPSAGSIKAERDRLDAQVAEVNRRLEAAYRAVDAERRSQTATSENLLKGLEAVERLQTEKDKLIARGNQVYSAGRQNCDRARSAWAEILDQADSEVEELLKELRETNEALTQARSAERIQDLALDIEVISKELSEKRSVARRLRQEYATTQREANKTRSELQAMSTAVSVLASWVVGLEQRVGNMSREIDARKRESQRLRQELKAAEEETRSLRVTNADIAALNNALRSAKDQSQRQQMQQGIAARERELRLRREVSWLEAEMRRIMACNNAVIMVKDAEAKAARAEATEARRLAKLEHTRVCRMGQERAALRREVEASKAECTALRTALAEADEDARQLEIVVQQRDATITQLESDASTKQHELEAAEKERDDAQETLETIKTVALVAGVLVVLTGLGFGVYGIFKRNGEKADLPNVDSSTHKVVVENERWYAIGGWSKTLFPTDRSAYTKADCTDDERPPEKFELHPGESWTGNWSVLPIGDKDGWIYAFNFPSSYYTDYFPTSFVRRRVHIRPYAFNEPIRKAPVHGGVYHIRPLHVKDKVLGCISGKSNNGTLVVLYDRDGTPNQRWKCTFRGDGLVSFTPSHSSSARLDLNVPVGASSHLWDNKDSNNPNQWLSLKESPEQPGAFRLMRIRDYAVVETKEGGRVNGTQLVTTSTVQTDEQKALSQLFWFEPQ